MLYFHAQSIAVVTYTGASLHLPLLMGSMVLSYVLYHLPPVNTTVTWAVLTPGDVGKEKTPILRHEFTANERELSICKHHFLSLKQHLPDYSTNIDTLDIIIDRRFSVLQLGVSGNPGLFPLSRSKIKV